MKLHRTTAFHEIDMPAADLDAIGRLIGRNIRFHRLVRELSQAKLAGEIGISFQQLQKYERGVNRISASRLWTIAQVLNVPIDAFFHARQTAEVHAITSCVPPE
jgi:transcriptional regulator with XRE-family HTH domain